MTTKLSHIRILMFFMAMAVTLPSYAKKLVITAPDQNNQKVIKRYNRYKHRDRFMSGRFTLQTIRTISVTSKFFCKNKEPTAWAGSLLISGCLGFNQKPVTMIVERH